MNDKDAHDLYRILRGIPNDVLTRGFTAVLEDRVSQEVSHIAVDGLKEHVASGPEAAFAVIAGRAKEGIGEPDTVSLATALLAQDLLDALGW